jgi:hypothetical protein
VQPDRQPLGHDQPGQRQRMGRAAHVLLHQPHAAGRLDVEAAAVEADALADDRDARMRPPCPIRARSAAARARGDAPADRGDQRIALAPARPEVTSTSAPKLPWRVARRLLELGRAEVGGRRVDQVADQRGRLGEADRSDRSRPLRRSQDARAALGLVLLER